ncbi:hypothetical protein HYS31_00540 [Candidatus Woesearchaeota archaeon]|nr:hypothetical protein [Candidatus Woesearchaeota archaeon]
MNKRAFEIQFNWLFVLIAGAAILMFFTVIIVKQKGVSETYAKSTVLKSVESIINSASVTTDTVKKEEIPASSIEIGCNRISVGRVSRQYQNLVLFAPQATNGEDIIWQTMGFNVPYRAANFLYITSQQVRYIIIGDSDLSKEINRSLPSELNKGFYSASGTSQIKNNNDQKIRFVIVSNARNAPDASYLQKFQKMKDSDVTAIVFSGNSEKGTIDFYRKKENIWEKEGHSMYIGKAAFIGAVYSDSKELYECSMKNAFSRLRIVNKVYIEKTTKLKNDISNPSCNYQAALEELELIGDSSILDPATLDIGQFQSKINNLVSASKSLSDENKELQRYSCPLVY